MEMEQELRKAVSEIKQGDKPNARKILENIIKNDPNCADAWYLLSYVASTQEQALGYLEKVIEINPFHEKAKQQLGKIMSKLPSSPPINKPKKRKESKSLLYIFLALIVTLLLVISCFVGTSTIGNSNYGQASQINQQWEYLSLSVNCSWRPPNKIVCNEFTDGWLQVPYGEMDSLGEYANLYGKEGWELISILKNEEEIIIPEHYVLLFKRPVQ